MKHQLKQVFTQEGFPLFLNLYYKDNSPQGSLPEKIIGRVNTCDENILFIIEKRNDYFKNIDSGVCSVNPLNLIPVEINQKYLN